MKDIQNEATFDYFKVEKETEVLGEAIDESDSILEDLEEMLIEYKINLDEMKCEMHLLQEKTSQMSTSRNNRKNFQQELAKFLDVVMLEPDLITCLSNSPIDETYLRFLGKILIKVYDILCFFGLSHREKPKKHKISESL